MKLFITILLLGFYFSVSCQSHQIVGFPANDLARRSVNIPPNNMDSINFTLRLADHLNNADFSWNYNTDRLYGSTADYVEYLSFKYNLGITSFIGGLNDGNANSVGVSDDWVVKSMNIGRAEYDLYLRTDRWQNPNFEIIPDYYSNTYTSSGAAVFSNAVVGQSKAVRSPNWGAELFAISGGTYGFDGNNYGTTSGAELFNMLDAHKNNWLNRFGILPVGMSYGNGQDGGKKMLANGQQFSSGRNSQWEVGIPSNSDSYYGVGGNNPQNESFDYDYVISKPSSSRFMTYLIVNGSSGTISTGELGNALSNSRQSLNLASNGGFFNNFTHSHYADGSTSIYTSSDLRYLLGEFFEDQRTEIDNIGKVVASHGHSSILSYGLLRDSTYFTSGSESSSSLTFTVSNNNSLPIRNLATFILDVTGTGLESQNLTLHGAEAIHKSGNIYTINTFVNLGASNTYTLVSSGSANYNLLDGVTVNVVYASGDLIITTNDETKYTAYWKPRNSPDVEYKVLGRGNNYNTTNYYDISNNDLGLSVNDVLSGDIVVGVINPFKVSATSTIIQYL